MGNYTQAGLEEAIETASGNWRCLATGVISFNNRLRKKNEADILRKELIKSVIEDAFIKENHPLAIAFFKEYLFFGDMEQKRMAYELFLHSLYSDDSYSKDVASVMGNFYLMDSSDQYVDRMIKQVGAESWLCPEDVRDRLDLGGSHTIHA